MHLFRSLALAVALVPSALAAPVTIPGGSILVSQAGGISTTNGAPASVRVFQTNGKEQFTLAIPTGKLKFQGARGGRIALSPDGQFVAIAGYIPPFSGSGDLNTRSESDAPRGFVTINLKNGAISQPVKVGEQDQESADAVVTDSGRAWLGGGDDLVYWDNGKTDVVFDEGSFVPTIFPNSLRYFGGDLFMTGLRTGYFGFVAAFDGLPHGDSDFPTVIFDVLNPEDLAVADGGKTIYVARSQGVVDVYEYNKSWRITRQFTSTDSALHGVTVDVSGKDPIVYAISSNSLWKVTDKGKNAKFQRVASAKSGYAFTGIVLTPGGGAPQVKLTSPRTVTTTKSSYTIRGTAADANGVKKVQVRRGKNGAYQPATGTTTWRYRAQLKPGANSFFVIATDASGNKSHPISVKITRK
jgi:hypothetical protein